MKKKLLLGSLGMICLSFQTTLADSTFKCEVVPGEFDNSVYQVRDIALVSTSEDFHLLTANRLEIDWAGKKEVLTRQALSVSSGSKLDYELASDPRVKAVLLTNSTPGEALREGSLKGLLVIMPVSIDLGGPVFKDHSIAYQLSCQ